MLPIIICSAVSVLLLIVGWNYTITEYRHVQDKLRRFNGE
jgi:hypothetical protein